MPRYPLAARMTISAVSVGAAVALSGCGRTIFDRPIDTSYDSRTVTGQLDFLGALPERSAITNDEAMHGVLLFANGTDPASSYEERVALLKERRWLQSSFDEPANMYAQRGTVARMLCRALEIDGGLWMHLTGAHPRYANRELIYVGIMNDGSQQQIISGLRFLTILGRAEDYAISRALRERQGEAEAAPETSTDAPEMPEVGPEGAEVGAPVEI
ncbi:MAG: hypothetical protein AAGI30_02975 [Planctomycetota bacterium]